jgi:hypothetical protein
LTLVEPARAAILPADQAKYAATGANSVGDTWYSMGVQVRTVKSMASRYADTTAQVAGMSPVCSSSVIALQTEATGLVPQACL